MFMPGIAVNPAAPINWACPLNRGLVGWWLHLPYGQWGRGTVLRDLVRGKLNDLTLTNGPTWSSQIGRPGGFGSLLFDNASTHYVTGAAVLTAEPISMACWFMSDDVGQATAQCLMSLGNNAMDQGAWLLQAQVSAAGDPVRATKQSDAGAAVAIDTSTGITQGKWHHAACTFIDDLTRHVWIDAGSKTSDTTTNVADPTPDRTTIGSLYRATALNLMSGYIDDCRIFNREITDTDVLEMREESLLGYPDTLNWLGSRKTFSFGGARHTYNTRSHPLGIKSGVNFRVTGRV